jgi:hypothetical protein
MFQVQAKQCKTCIYGPNWRGRPIAELEDQVREKHRGATGFSGYRVCHSQKRSGKVCCRGFWNKHKNHFAMGQIAQRLGWVEFVEPVE